MTLAFTASGIVAPVAAARSGPAKEDPPSIELDDSHKAVAQSLFEAGVEQMEAGDLRAACESFSESQRLDPALGTRFNLADCYERLGKLASAWAHYVGVADAAERLGQMDRAQFARTRAEQIEPKLGHLQVDVGDPVPGIEVRRDGVVVGPVQWATEVPVDRGSHTIAATAEGYEPWDAVVEVERDGDTVRVTVPALVPIAVVEAPQVDATVITPGPIDVQPRDPEPPSPRPRIGPRHIAGIVIGSVGLVGLGVGAGYGALATRRRDDAETRCPQPDACFADGASRLRQAESAGTASTVLFAVGGALLTAGIVLIATGHLGGGARMRRQRAARR
ncbi:MAG: hypothetical protein AAF721_13720 [Myxococcota bacterium]